MASLEAYRSQLISSVMNASDETLQDVLVSEVGMSGGSVNFSVVERQVATLLDRSSQNSIACANSVIVELQRTADEHNKVMTGLLQNGIKALGGMTVTSGAVIAARNILAPAFAFKPWGAINLAKGITKGLGIAAVGLTIALQIYSVFKKKENAEKLAQAKYNISAAIEDYFANVFKQIQGDSYLESFSSNFKQVNEELENRRADLNSLKDKLSSLEKYKENLKKTLLYSDEISFQEVGK